MSLAAQALFAAELQFQHDADGAALGFLRQQGALQAVRQGEALGARFDIVGARVERLALRHDGAARVAGQLRRHVGVGRHNGAVRRIGGDETAQGAVRALQVFLGRRLHLRRRQLVELVALQEEQTPVAGRQGLRQGNRQARRVRGGQFDLFVQLLLDARHFRIRDRLRFQLFQHFQHGRLRRIEVAIDGHQRAEQVVARLQVAHRVVFDLAGQLGFHQRLVQTASGGVRQHVAEHLDGDGVRVAGRRHVVAGADELRAAAAAHRHGALAILHGLGRVGGFDHARGFRDLAKQRIDLLQDLGFIEAARHHQHGIIGLIVFMIKRAQAGNVDLLDVGTGADGRLAIVVPVVGDGLDAFARHADRIALAHLELVAHDRHFTFLRLRVPQVVLVDGRVDHAVRFHGQHLAQVVVVGGEGGVVIGAVVPGGAVELRARRVQDLDGGFRALLDAEVGAGLEQQVFQQVGHARFAIVFMARTDQVDDVGGQGRLAGIGEQQHAQAIGQAVFGDAFDGRDLDGGAAVGCGLAGFLGRCGFHRGGGQDERRRQDAGGKQEGGNWFQGKVLVTLRYIKKRKRHTIQTQKLSPGPRCVFAARCNDCSHNLRHTYQLRKSLSSSCYVPVLYSPFQNYLPVYETSSRPALPFCFHRLAPGVRQHGLRQPFPIPACNRGRRYRHARLRHRLSRRQPPRRLVRRQLRRRRMRQRSHHAVPDLAPGRAVLRHHLAGGTGRTCRSGRAAGHPAAACPPLTPQHASHSGPGQSAAGHALY